MLIEKTRIILGLLATALLVACTTPPPGPDPDPAPGAIAVTVSNLPAGVPAAIRVTGPNGYAQDIAQSQTLANLAPGEYTVTATSVPGSGITYLPSAGVQVAVVATRATTPVSISYTGVTFRLGIQEVATLPGAVFLTSPPGDPRQFIVEREGLIHVMENGVLLSTPFLDIHERVLSQGEGGLLSMASRTGRALFLFRFLPRLRAQLPVRRRRRRGGNGLADQRRGQYPVIRTGCRWRAVPDRLQRQDFQDRQDLRPSR